MFELDLLFELEFSQVLLSLIGSFFGFGFALLSGGLVNMNRERIRINRIQDNLHNELRRIYRTFKPLNNSDLNSQAIFIEMPIWNSVVSTGDLLILLKKDRNFYDRVLPIYCKIPVITQMGAEQKYCDQRLALIGQVVNEIEGLKLF